MKKLWDLKNVFSNLELEGQGLGIIMGVTPTSPRAILHHTDQFYVLFFAHDCSLPGSCGKGNYNLLNFLPFIFIFGQCDIVGRGSRQGEWEFFQENILECVYIFLFAWENKATCQRKAKRKANKDHKKSNNSFFFFPFCFLGWLHCHQGSWVSSSSKVFSAVIEKFVKSGRETRPEDFLCHIRGSRLVWIWLWSF